METILILLFVPIFLMYIGLMLVLGVLIGRKLVEWLSKKWNIDWF